MSVDTEAQRAAPLVLETGEVQPPKPHFWLMYLYCFLVFMEWSIIVPSIIQYLIDIGDSEAEAEDHFAFAQTGFAVGQLAVSLVAGLLMIWLKSFKVLFLISSVLVAVGNVLYALADPTALNSVLILLAGRIIAGIGAGGSSVGLTYMACMCDDRKKYVAIVGRYRTAGVTATVFGAAIAGLFSWADFTIGGFRIYAATLPGLFTAACFVVWGIACALLIHGTPKSGGVTQAYRWNSQILMLFVIIGLGSCTGAAMIYIMPSIMGGYAWGTSTQSIFFTVASVGTLIGSLIGQEKRVIKFKPATREFDAFVVVTLCIIAMIVSLVLMWCGVILASDLAKHICFVIGTAFVMASYSLLNNVGSTLLVLVFTESEKIAMTPFTTSVVAFGKIASPLLVDAGLKFAQFYHITDWILVFAFWLGITLVVLILSLVNRNLLAKTSQSSGTAEVAPAVAPPPGPGAEEASMSDQASTISSSDDSSSNLD